MIYICIFEFCLSHDISETNEGRKEKLAKWKAERELKKKLDAEKKAKKPGFKVTHVPEKKKAPKQEITFAPLPKVILSLSIVVVIVVLWFYWV